MLPPVPFSRQADCKLSWYCQVEDSLGKWVAVAAEVLESFPVAQLLSRKKNRHSPILKLYNQL